MGTPRNSFTDFQALASLESIALSPKPFSCGSCSTENRKAPPPPDVGSARQGLVWVVGSLLGTDPAV